MSDLHGIIGNFLEGNIRTLGGDANIEPKNITENGTYTVPEGVDGYNPITVNVPSTPPVVEELNATENGTYTPDEGVDGFNPVTVNVPQTELIPLTINNSGIYTPPRGKAYNQVTAYLMDNNIKMGNMFNTWKENSMSITCHDGILIDTRWNGGNAFGCQLYSNFDLHEYNSITINGFCTPPHYYQEGYADIYKIDIGFSSTKPFIYSDINYIDRYYYVPQDNASFTYQMQIPNQECYLVLSVGGWNLSDIEIELVKTS